MNAKFFHGIYVILLLSGIILRAWFSTLPYNVDITNYLKDVEIFHQGENIYSAQSAYNYTPVWFYILGTLDQIRTNIFPSVPFAVFIRLFLSVVDVVTLVVLTHIARTRKISIFHPLLFYFLNPISMIISSKHGQFDNFAILFLILSWLSFQKKLPFIAWLLGTMALLTKHIVLFPLLILFFSHWGVKKVSSELPRQ
ncbi:MAG: hypothetical protein ACOY3M_04945 [Patescibacteria group bacterium]